MQALCTHLERPGITVLTKEWSVQGLNTPFQGEFSFEKLLKQAVFSQDVKAREGPPDSRELNTARQDIRSAEKTDALQDEEQAADEPARFQHTEKTDRQESSVQSFEEEKTAAGTQAEEDRLSDNDAKLVQDAGEKNGSESVLLPSDVLMQPESMQTQVSVDTEHADAFFIAASDVQITRSPQVFEDVRQEAAMRAATAENGETKTEYAAAVSVVPHRSGSAGAKQKHKTEPHARTEHESVADKAVKNGTSLEKDVRLAQIPSVIVRDERTKVPQSREEKHSFADSVRYDGKGQAQADVFLNTADVSKTGIPSAFSAKEATTSAEQVQSRFTSMLSSEIRTNAAELVKAGSIILRDGNRGTINLILHPEELGNVKIRLQISDNILTGRITVASEEAYHAFKSNIAALTEAFASNGFDTAGFDLSWSGQQEADGGKNGQKHPFAFRYDEQAVFAEDTVPSGELNFDSRSSVNLMA